MIKFHGSKGNQKCGYPNIGMSPIKSCPGAVCAKCPCCCDKQGNISLEEGSCYVFSEKPGAAKAHEENYQLWKTEPERYKKELEGWIALTGIDTLRISEAGDMPDISYAEYLIDLAKRNPQIQFFGFTKNYKIWDLVNRLPFWKLPNFNLVLSEWGDLKPSEELRRYYNTATAVSLFDYDKAEQRGFRHCGGNCQNCDRCKYKKGGDVYFVIHGKKGFYEIPEEYRINEKLDLSAPGAVKFGGKTINGIRDKYCEVVGTNDYEARTKALVDVWKKIQAREIRVYKNGFTMERGKV